MGPNGRSDRDIVPLVPDPSDMVEVPDGRASERLYDRIVLARRARRARLLRRVAGLLLLVAALGLIATLVAASLSPTLAPPVLRSVSPLTPDSAAATRTRSAPTSHSVVATRPVGATTAPSSVLAHASAAAAATTAPTPAPIVSPAASATLPVAGVTATATQPLASPSAFLPSMTVTSTPSVATQSATLGAGTQLPLSGRRIGLDPAYGPRGDLGVVLTDPASGKLILSEAEFDLDVALRTRDLLLARGATVMLTRETPDTFTAPWPVDANGDGIVGGSADDLQERIDILNTFKADVFLSIQANGGSASPPAGQDVQVIYCGTADCAFSVQSKQLGQLVLDQLRAKLAEAGYAGQGGRLLTDLSADNSSPPQHLFLLGPASPPKHVRATSMPGVISASLYVTSPQQAAELNKSSVRQAIAQAYADALQAYLTAKAP
ncbi:MAG: N-acetylmuramoyl-L-alanine amidase [Chloroflexota bacterium]|nr:N-acetylmuramoyl-L-alanine amidase [Chloroflexota bacterium]